MAKTRSNRLNGPEKNRIEKEAKKKTTSATKTNAAKQASQEPKPSADEPEKNAVKPQAKQAVPVEKKAPPKPRPVAPAVSDKKKTPTKPDNLKMKNAEKMATQPEKKNKPVDGGKTAPVQNSDHTPPAHVDSYMPEKMEREYKSPSMEMNTTKKENIEKMSSEKAPDPKKEAPSPLDVLEQEDVDKSLLMEIAWEVCNQVGGIYTVIQSKVPATKIKWGENYLLLGPYFGDQAAAMFEHDKTLYAEEFKSSGEQVYDPVKETVKAMNDMGFSVHYGTWLIDGRPKVVLFDPNNLLSRIHEHKYIFWEHHNISLPGDDFLVNQVVSFGFQVYEFIRLLAQSEHTKKKLLAHFHEWMAGIPIPELRRHNVDVRIVFTTHATMLGRYLAMNDPKFYDHLPFYDWKKEAEYFNISHIVEIERAASHGAHIFSTVSDITANECKYLIGREPEAILPNGLNIKRFEVMHEFQQLHKQTKGKINEFVMGHFFHNYTFDLDKTLYFFTSGRFEYYNKGFDLTLEALARLNWKMKSENIDKTVVMFFITRNPYHGINSSVLESRAKLEEIRRNVDDIQEVLAEKLFDEMLSRSEVNDLPNLNELVDDYLALRLRRNIGSWRNKQMPAIVTHDLVDEGSDPIMNFLKTSHLLNYREDKVKVVYHPDFVSTANPLFRMEYLQFVRGCHLGVFPSYYEPWGYTPLECCASGLPSITTDLAGFGSYIKNHLKDNFEKGLWLVNRRNRPMHEVAEDIANLMFDFVKLERRERIALRNRIEENSPMFGWRQLRKYYDNAYAKVLKF